LHAARENPTLIARRAPVLALAATLTTPNFRALRCVRDQQDGKGAAVRALNALLLVAAQPTEPKLDAIAVAASEPRCGLSATEASSFIHGKGVASPNA